jgi:hypothetical protein
VQQKYTTPLSYTHPSMRENHAAPCARPWFPTKLMASLFDVGGGRPRGEREEDVRLLDLDPLHAVRGSLRLRPGQIRLRRSRDREHLEAATVGQAAGLHRVARRDVPVEAGREPEVVLGQVQDAAIRVECDRLVSEAPRALDRLAIRLPAGRHLEDVAVRLLQRDVRSAREVGTDVGAVDRLLTGDPAPPRHGTTHAVHLRAVEAREGLGDDALPVYQRGRRPARRHRVVRLSRSERRRRPVDFVVPDEPSLPLWAWERGHAVMPAWERGAVAEDDSRPVGVVERAVPETLGQVQPHLSVAQVCDGTERSEARRRLG